MSTDYPTTSWTLFSEARRGGSRGRAAKEAFTRRYYGPVRAYLRARFRGTRHDADEHTNEFFATKILAGNLLLRAKPGYTRFRHYLKRCVNNYSLTVLGGLERTVPLDDVQPAPFAAPAGWSDVDRAFHLEWVRGVLSRAIARVRVVCEAHGQQMHFELFCRRNLHGEERDPPWAEVGRAVAHSDGSVRDVDEKTARHLVETVLRHVRQAILDEFVEETGSVEAAREEIATLGALF
jgi:hypothetical protein